MTDLGDQPELDSSSSSSSAALPRVFTKSQICSLLRISGGMFDRLMRDGAPFIQRGAKQQSSWKIDAADFVRFMLEDAVRKAGHSRPSAGDGTMSLDEAKRKDKEVQANIRELDLLKLQGEQVDIEDARKVLREVFAVTRSRLMSVPAQVAGLSNNQQTDLEEAMNDALAELSEGGDFNFGQDDETAPAIAHH
jgi:hypothetical protein